MKLTPALAPLEAYQQFINYKLVPRADGGMDKVPLDPRTGATAGAQDPEIWVSYQEAAATDRPVGFVFTEEDPFFFLDIDHCSDGAGGWSQTAVALLTTFQGCAVEVSQSGEGLHVFGRIPAAIPHGCDNKPIGSQFYTSNRFVALTGDRTIGSADFTPSAGAYTGFLGEYFPPPLHTASEDWTDEPCEEWAGPAEDDDLIARILKSVSPRAAMGHAATVQQLWAADEDELAKQFPPIGPGPFDHSMADMALLVHLAFWTGKDCERMDRLFRLSGLCRDKWLDREPYRETSILKAVGMVSSVYNKPPDRTPEEMSAAAEAVNAQLGCPVPCSNGDGIRVGFQFADVQAQREIFKGCCYVRDIHRCFVPDGALLRPEQFKAYYGGYVYALDANMDKTTKNAWEAFTESQGFNFPKAHSTCFRPLETPGGILAHDGYDYVNTYIPISTPATEGDAAPFLALLDRLFPIGTDRAIILAYMAACVQHVGVKFQWAPLIQGTEGNGKSFLGSALTFAVGERYTHMPDPKDLSSVFNSWLSGKLLIVIEEIYTGDRSEVVETLKWMVTNSRVPSQAKGQDQTTGDNAANFLLFSNHKDAVKKTKSDRRFCMFYTGQQSGADIARDGMGGDYFPRLYAWARGGGFAIINHYLSEYAIPDALNPAASCHRAPMTSSTGEAIDVSRGALESAIIEAEGDGRPGFCGGWVSSLALSTLMREMNIRLQYAKRADMLKEIGYIRHAGLYEGRVNGLIMAEGGKPRLFVKAGHVSLNISGATEITRAYEAAQGYVLGSAPGATVVAAG